MNICPDCKMPIPESRLEYSYQHGGEKKRVVCKTCFELIREIMGMHTTRGNNIPFQSIEKMTVKGGDTMPERQKYKIETGTNLRDILEPYQADKHWELVSMTYIDRMNLYECIFRFILIKNDIEP